MQDRRLVVVIQGDAITTTYQMWLETPCDDHGQDVVSNQLAHVEGIEAESPHTWLQVALQYAADHMCFCGGVSVPQDAVAKMLEATRA